MATSFSAQVDEWTRKTEARLLAVFKRAVELLADELTLGRQSGGKVPWDTGNMARSLVAALNAEVSVSGSPSAGGDVGAQIAMATLGDVITLGYQAIYARRQNYGFVGQDSLGRTYNQEGAHFVEYAISMWPTMVALAVEEIKGSVN